MRTGIYETPESVTLFATSVAHSMSAVLEPAPVAVCLHGSATTGAWIPDRSDVDVLGIVPAGLEHLQRTHLAEAVLELEGPAYLDLVIVTERVASNPGHDPAYEMIVYTPEPPDFGGRGSFVLVNLAQARAYGRSVVGPDPTDVVSDVPQFALCVAMAATLASENEDGSYLLLNACRALMYLREGVLVSKLAGAEWASKHGEVDVGAARVALDHAQGRSLQDPDPRMTDAFVERVRGELLEQASGDARG